MSEFAKAVIRATKSIPKGKVASYGQIALMCGVPRGAQQVGWILHQYGGDEGVPWWRVINNAGRISTKCIEHTASLQKTLLEKEGVAVTDKLRLDIEKYRYRPDPKALHRLKLAEDYIEELLGHYGI